jgi:hypothetical protein
MKFQKTAQETGLVVAGMVAANLAVKSVQNSFVPAATAAAGFLAASYSKSSLVQSIGVGAAAFGTIALLNQVATPKAGEVATGYKAMIGKVVPSLNGVPGVGFLGLGTVDMDAYDIAPYDELEGLYGDEADKLLGIGAYNDYMDEIEGLEGLTGEEVAKLMS